MSRWIAIDDDKKQRRCLELCESVCVDLGGLCRFNLVNEVGVGVSKEPPHAILPDGFVEPVQIPESLQERAAEELIRHECPHAV